MRTLRPPRARPGGRPGWHREFKVFDGAGPHNVAPTASGKVWFTEQAAGELGRLDPIRGGWGGCGSERGRRRMA